VAEATTRPRTGFAPVVLLGLASAGLAAVAGNKPWAVTRARTDFLPGDALQQTADRFPLAGAVALLLLATWGVLLVTRGLARRLLAGLGAVVALGMLSFTVLGPPVVRDQVTTSGADTLRLSGWYWAYLVAAVLALVAMVLAARLAPRWPEMGTRYDAPAPARTQTEVDAADDAGNRDLWKAIDEGHDPTG
jgi:uncharacterized membrane protein (TIGR02234 family)